MEHILEVVIIIILITILTWIFEPWVTPKVKRSKIIYHKKCNKYFRDIEEFIQWLDSNDLDFDEEIEHCKFF